MGIDVSSLQKIELSMEWLGAFLLAIEAIKLRNLAAIRIMCQRYRDLTLPMLNLNKETRRELSELDDNDGIGCLVSLGACAIFFIMGQSITIRFVTGDYDFLGETWHWFSQVFPSGRFGSVLSGAITALIYALCNILFGWAEFVLILSVLSAVIGGLSFIEKNTTNGITGMLGFLIFSASMLMKLGGLN